MTLLRELVDLGADVIAIDSEDNPVARSICGNVRVLPCSGSFMRMGRWHLNLLRRVQRLDIEHDVLFDPTGYPNVLGDHPRQAVLVHDLSMFRRGLYRRGKRTWFRLFYGRALRKAQLRVCVSTHTRQELIERFDLPEKGCVVVPNSLDPEFGAPIDGEPHAAMPEGPFFLTVGTIERRKNTDRLLEAFARADVPHCLVLAGRPGTGSEEILRRAAGLGERVLILTGTSDVELRHLYRRATALLFPSLEEGFGLPILEAMQSDLPVLTANVSAMPEVAGDAALLVDPTDVLAIRDGLVRLSRDEELRRDLVARGRLRLPLFDARRNTQALLAHLRGLP
jgi:glycosyltransferase involved in cell wall biosynthesis